MPITFAGFPVFCPEQARKTCVKNRLPVGSWYAQANQYTLGLGATPAKGCILMLRRDLDIIDTDGFHRLTFDDNIRRFNANRVYITSTQCITPGAENDPDSLHVVHLTDIRGVLKNKALQRFNLPLAPGSVSYNSETLNGGGQYTVWNMVKRLVQVLRGSSGAENLFQTQPDAQGDDYAGPWDFSDARLTLWEALEQIGNAKGWVYSVDPDTSVIRFRKRWSQPGYESARTAHQPRKIWASETITREAARTTTVTVGFRFYPQVKAGDSEYYYLTRTRAQAGATTPSVSGGNIVTIFDDLPAFRESTSGLNSAVTPSNSAALTTRANARALDWFDNVDRFREEFDEIYSGVLEDRDFLPGGLVASICWRDLGKGIVTEVCRLREHPCPMQAYRPHHIAFFETELVRRTGASTTDAQGDTWYPGEVVRWTPTNANEYSTLCACWLKPENGGELGNNTTVYLGKYLAPYTISGTQRPAYSVTDAVTVATGIDLVTKVCLTTTGFPAQVIDGCFGDGYDESDWDLVGSSLSLRYEKRNVSLPDGTHIGDPSCVDDAANCCDGSPPDPPSNPPGDPIGNDPSGCCSPAPANGLLATMARVSGGYNCLDGNVFPLNYSSGSVYWIGQNAAATSYPLSLCPEYAITPPNSCEMGAKGWIWCDAGVWKGSFLLFGGTSWQALNITADSVACPSPGPLSIVFTAVFTLTSGQPFPTGCNTGTAPTFTITLTER